MAGVIVSIVAFQAVDPGLIPGPRNFMLIVLVNDPVVPSNSPHSHLTFAKHVAQSYARSELCGDKWKATVEGWC